MQLLDGTSLIMLLLGHEATTRQVLHKKLPDTIIHMDFACTHRTADRHQADYMVAAGAWLVTVVHCQLAPT